MAFFSDDGDLFLDDNLFEFWGALYDLSELDSYSFLPSDATDEREVMDTTKDKDMVSTSQMSLHLSLSYTLLLRRQIQFWSVSLSIIPSRSSAS